MTMDQLSPETLQLIGYFTHLKIGTNNVPVPYFNNRRVQVRGALRVNIGKGNPRDIKEELKILSLREKIDLREFSSEQISKFLVDHHIGIDCSGLAYYILDTELQARGYGTLKKNITFPFAKNPLRKLLAWLRPVENCGVSTLAHEVNSVLVELKDVQPGDMIVMLNAGPRKDYNHVAVILNVAKNPGGSEVITYVHSFKYPTDGLYNHGVREESIEIIKPNGPLTEQKWNEEKMSQYVKTAEKVEIRRLRCFLSFRAERNEVK